MVDELFDHFRLGGFRADIVWLCLSSGIVFFAGWVLMVQARTNSRLRVSAGLCALEVLSFAMYVWHALMSGLLYFG